MSVLVPNYNTDGITERFPDRCINPLNSEFDFLISALNKNFYYKGPNDSSVTTLNIDNIGVNNLFLAPNNNLISL